METENIFFIAQSFKSFLITPCAFSNVKESDSVAVFLQQIDFL